MLLGHRRPGREGERTPAPAASRTHPSIPDCERQSLRSKSQKPRVTVSRVTVRLRRRRRASPMRPCAQVSAPGRPPPTTLTRATGRPPGRRTGGVQAYLSDVAPNLLAGRVGHRDRDAGTVTGTASKGHRARAATLDPHDPRCGEDSLTQIRVGWSQKCLARRSTVPIKNIRPGQRCESAQASTSTDRPVLGGLIS